MGLLDSLLTKWRSRKRTADDSKDSIENKERKRPRTENYILTPDSKTGIVVDAKKNDSEFYYYGRQVNQTESRTYEFKAGGILFSRDISQFIQKYASAFFNSGGGVILAGVTDDGLIKGVSCSPFDKEKLHAAFSDEMRRFRPNVSDNMWSIRYNPVLFDNQRSRPFFGANQLYVVEIKFLKGKTDEVYETGNHEVYLRQEGSVYGPLKPLELKHIVITKYKETKISQRKENSSKVIPVVVID